MGRPLTACACILAAVALFVLNSELMQAESAAVPPFFMIWLCHSGQALFVPLAPAAPPPTAASAAPTTLLRPVSRAAFALSVGTMTCNYLFVVALGMASVTVVNAIGHDGPARPGRVVSTQFPVPNISGLSEDFRLSIRSFERERAGSKTVEAAVAAVR